MAATVGLSRPAVMDLGPARPAGPQLGIEKASPVSQLTFAAVLIMPLSLASLQAGAQMVPVSGAEPLPISLPESSSHLYSTSSTADAPALDVMVTASSSTSVATEPEPTGESPAASSSYGEPVLPAPASVPAAPAFAPAAPASMPATPAGTSPGASVAALAAPVILTPKPAKVRDLPSPLRGDQPRVRPFRAVAFGLTASSLGAGAELAIPVARTLNVRAGGNYVLLHYPFNIDGIDYSPGLKFTSGRATVDWFPHRGAFHVSAGALYFRNSISGTADVVEAQTFSLGGTNYINSVDDPIHGAASIAYGKQIAPMVLLGFGNILPRSGRHVSMPFEFGGAYMRAPTLNLKLSGTACTMQGCFNAATDPQVQSNLTKEVNTLQSDMRFLQVYPIVSLGLACRF